jgi:hypothetical protein
VQPVGERTVLHMPFAAQGRPSVWCAPSALSCPTPSLVQAAAPGLAWSTFFEEPAMLLAFVLLGRTLEQRAKIAASSNLLALQARSGPAPVSETIHLRCCGHLCIVDLQVEAAASSAQWSALAVWC